MFSAAQRESGNTEAQRNRQSRHVPLQTPERVPSEQRPRAQTHQYEHFGFTISESVWVCVPAVICVLCVCVCRRVVTAHLRFIVQLQGNDERRERAERPGPADRPTQTPQVTHTHTHTRTLHLSIICHSSLSFCPSFLFLWRVSEPQTSERREEPDVFAPALRFCVCVCVWARTFYTVSRSVMFLTLMCVWKIETIILFYSFLFYCSI